MGQSFFSYGGSEPATGASERVTTTQAILSQLSDEDWEKLIGFTARRRYPHGAFIVRSGDIDRAMYFVVDGKVSSDSPGQARRVVGEGELFGLLSFLDGAPSAITVQATGSVEVLMLDPAGLAQLAAWQPRIAVSLLRDLAAHVASRLRRLQPGE